MRLAVGSNSLLGVFPRSSAAVYTSVKPSASSGQGCVVIAYHIPFIALSKGYFPDANGRKSVVARTAGSS
jgi:hypothetical protein